MANPAGESDVDGAPIVWNYPTGPLPLVNYFLLRGLEDGDGGPGEIVVYLGYAVPDQNVPVTNVAGFTLTRYRAEQLMGYLKERIDDWDRMNEVFRKRGRHDPLNTDS